jgi:hypothetical protein
MLLLVTIAHRHTPLFAIARSDSGRMKRFHNVNLKVTVTVNMDNIKKQQLLSQHNTLNLLNTTTQYTAKAQTTPTRSTYSIYILQSSSFFIS